MLQQYVPNVSASGFMLQVGSVLFECFMYFTYMLQVHVPNVSSIFSFMLHSCCKCFLLFGWGRVEGVWTGCAAPQGWQTGALGPAD
jgi:hypothetical protein